MVTVAFGATAALYTLAAVSHVLYMFRRELAELARWSTRIAWGVQTLSLIAVIVYTGRAPVYTLFEFAFFFAWVMVTNYMVIEFWRGDQTPGSFLTPVIAMVTLAAATLPKPGLEGMIQEFPASLILWHVSVSLFGYGFFTASFVAGALYLIQEGNLRHKRWGPLYYRLPSLEVLDQWSGRFVAIGFPLMTIGLGSGLGFARVTWQTVWHLDPKVLFTFFTWAVYGGYLLMRVAWGWRGRKLAWWTIAGVFGVMINYFVINLLSSMHRFGV